jgi:FkbM family methyltransferase
MSVKSKFLELKNNGFVPKRILDIGANIGDFTMLCKEIWHESESYLIEANYNCESYLKKIHAKFQIEVLGDEDDKCVDFFLTKENDICTGNSVYLEKTEHYSFDNLIIEKRKTKKLDTIFKEDVFDLIKIDTQGSELDILKGGVSVVKRAKYVLIETSLKEYNKDAPFEQEIINFMNTIDFVNFIVLENHVWPIDGGLFKKGEIFQRDLIFYKN